MDYITIKETAKKWNISERRIRKLLQDGRIEGAYKAGNAWNIPCNANKPVDKRTIKIENNFIINIDKECFEEIDKLKKILNNFRPIPKTTLDSLKETINLEWTYHSNAIEGNTLTLRETQVVLEGITIGGKTVKEHIEAINHNKAIFYLEDLVNDDNPITEWNIKCLHQLILKNIGDEYAGRYREEDVIVKGANHIPPVYLRVSDYMEQLIFNYKSWNNYHPIVKAALLHGELVKIHPFVDGNGRTARLIMNLDLMNHGYVPVIIKKENRVKYYDSLDKAHLSGDYTDFIKLVLEAEKDMLNKYIDVLNIK